MGVPILDVRVNVAKQACAAAATRYSPRKRRDYYRPALLAPRAAIAAIRRDIVVSVAGAVTALQLYCCLGSRRNRHCFNHQRAIPALFEVTTWWRPLSRRGGVVGAKHGYRRRRGFCSKAAKPGTESQAQSAHQAQEATEKGRDVIWADLVPGAAELSQTH